jgi:glycosyltransferase involved in cell wall biosynthesis
MADAVIALTNVEKQTLIEIGVQEEKIYVTGNGPIISTQADPLKFLELYRINGPMVLFIGQHYPYKGYKQTLEAARLVWQRVPDVHFVFIGPTIGKSEREFQAISDQRIHRLGAVDQKEKSDALAACTCFAYRLRRRALAVYILKPGGSESQSLVARSQQYLKLSLTESMASW